MTFPFIYLLYFLKLCPYVFCGFRCEIDPRSQTGQRGAHGKNVILQTFRGILSKLTPQKFEVLVKRVDELSLDTEERLKEVIQLITEKAALDGHRLLYAETSYYMKG